MMRICFLAMALLSLALATGCATGGNGVVPPPPSIDVEAPTGISTLAIYPTQSFTITATVSNSTTTAVNWSLSGTSCSGSACGTLTPATPPTTPATAVFVAPVTPTPVTVTATLVSNPAITGTLGLTMVPVTVVVTPVSVSVGENLVQQFAAIAEPDTAPQTFTWGCTPTGSCGSLVQDQNTSGLAVYTAPTATGSVAVAATSTVGQSNPGVGQSKVSVVSSLLAAGSYAFQFSGYDAEKLVAVAGSLSVDKTGGITGIEDVMSQANGPSEYTITSGSYTPSAASNNFTNNQGTLALTLSNKATNFYTAVLSPSGVLRMIETDDSGITGSGVLEKSAAGTVFNDGAQTFAFGFTGADANGNRVGYVGLLPMDGQGNIGNITPGMLDINDNGTATSYSSVTGTYTQDANGVWQMTLKAGTDTLGFDFYVAGGTAQTKTGPGSLTLYAISTDPITTNPAVSGSMVYQVPATYNNAAFSGTSVSNLTGVTPMVANSSDVALIVAVTDGTNGGTGGAGGFFGSFDQNNNGAITSISATSPFSYTYVASSSTTGRYVFQMLGNPNSSPVVAPLPFVLYASGANRGFLLDQSSAAVMIGSMDPQPTNLKSFEYANSEMPGVYAAATTTNAVSSITPVVQNLLLTNPPTGSQMYAVSGIQNPGIGTLTGTYLVNDNSITQGSIGGTGAITLTSPPAPAVATNVIYAIDASNAPGSKLPVITDFWLMGTTSGTPSSLIFAEQ
jgi:hypothetical protein